MDFELEAFEGRLPGFALGVMLEARKHTRKRPRIVQDTTSVRRHKEAQTIYTMAKYIPMEESQLERANQPIVLRLAVQYVKLRKLLQENLRDQDLFRCQQQFHGFFLVVDLAGTIVYASNSITHLLGPHLIDVIGQDFLDLLHTEDKSTFRDLDVQSEKDLFKLSPFKSSVLRMKTNMSPTIRSQAKIQYKNVLVTSQFKRFKFHPCDDEANEKSPSSSVMFLALCRTEELIGLPEIVIGGSFDVFINIKNEILDMDWKTQWFTGYKKEDALRTKCSDFVHPTDFPKAYSEEAIAERNKNLRKNGVAIKPPQRVMTAWGEWIWIQITLYLPSKEDRGDHRHSIRCACRIYGPDDGSVMIDEPTIVKREPEEHCCPSSAEDYFSLSWRNMTTAGLQGTGLDKIQHNGAYHPSADDQDSSHYSGLYTLSSSHSPSSASLASPFSGTSDPYYDQPGRYVNDSLPTYSRAADLGLMDRSCSTAAQERNFAEPFSLSAATTIGPIH